MLNGLSKALPRIPADGSYYYFSRLTDEQKGVYKAILSGIKNYSKEIKMPIRPTNEIAKIFNCVLLDNPKIFYVSASFKQTSDLYKQKCTVIPEYKFTPNETRGYTNEIIKCLRALDSVKNKRDIEKELYVHDYCLKNFSYDYTFGSNSYSVLGLALNKAAVCEGIAKFVKLAFDYLGLSSLVVFGKAKNPIHDSKVEGHAWNIVRIDGKTYHLDVTFDMTIKNKIIRYDYFNLSDVEIKRDHIIIDDVPSCLIVGNDYYSVNSLFVNNIGELDNFISKALKQGKRHVLVKIKNEPYTDAVVNRIMGIAQRQYSQNYTGSTMIETSYNSSQMVFEIIFK